MVTRVIFHGADRYDTAEHSIISAANNNPNRLTQLRKADALRILAMKLLDNNRPTSVGVNELAENNFIGERPNIDGDGANWNWNAILYAMYGVIIVIGMVTNFYVVYRMRCFRKRNREQYRNGIGICLCAMAVSHLVALMSLLINFVLIQTTPLLSTTVHAILCKLVLFTTHTAYTQSMWCWLFMSGLRYLATTRPLQYTTLWRLPFTAMSVVLVGAVIENSWLLITLDIGGVTPCTRTLSMLNRVHRLFDICISFVIPTSLVFYMDTVVMCRRKKNKLVDPMLQFVINRPNIETKRMFYRFLLITVSILLLNLPDNFLRFVSVFEENKQSWSIFRELCHLLFFSQFAFNAFYLTMHVYDKSVLSKTNSSRQLSISFRQRLEESSHMLRERSSTISYRATTPVLPLARNSSCCALDELVPKKHWL